MKLIPASVMFVLLGQARMSPAFVLNESLLAILTSRAARISFSLYSSVIEKPPLREEKNQKPRGSGGMIAKVLRRTEEGEGITNTRRKPERIETIEEYKSVVADETEKLVVVRFYSPVCRSCKAAEKYFHKLCRENPDVKFVELPTTKDNSFLHEGLGVETFPFGHIYHPDAGLVEELKINKKVFGDFERTLKYYIDGKGEVDYSEQGLCEPAGCRIDYND